MSTEKTFDCIAAKDEIQRRRRERYAGLSDEVIRQRLRETLDTSPDPVAKKWRELDSPEKAEPEAPQPRETDAVRPPRD